jgi:hypothetical protein
VNPGIYHDLDADVYHSGPGLSNSQLNDFARSPFHYFQLHRNPARPARETKGGQLEGSLAHCAILEPDSFASRYVIGPSVNRNTKVWKEFIESNTDRIAIQQDQYDVAFGQAVSIRLLPQINALLANGKPEVSAYWNDPQTGVLCRARPDFVADVNEESVILLDVKTYSDADPREFERQVSRKGYARQDAHYSTGYSRASGKRVVGFIFVCVESNYPFAASASMLDDESRAAGFRQVQDLIANFSQCEANNAWPAFGQEIHQIALASWAM